MSPKFRLILIILLSIFAICSQVVFGKNAESSKTIPSEKSLSTKIVEIDG